MQTIGDREPLRGELGRFYDAIENPRKTRGELPILRDDELRSYLADVRERTLDVLDEVEIDADHEDRLLREGFVYEMLLAHELQHNETMLQLLMLVDGYSRARLDPPPRPAARRRARRRSRSRPANTRSARREGFAYDNERPPTRSSSTAFEIDRTPVSNGAYIEFIEDTGIEPPMYWERVGDGDWADGDGPEFPDRSRAPRRPRLLGGGRRLRPLGRQAAADRVRVGGGARPSSTALGAAWEWTSSHFLAYPGFEAFPYPEYSEVFFGDEHRVLRGASWATHRERRPAELPQLGPAPAAADIRRLALREGRRSEADRDGRPGRDRGPLHRRPGRRDGSRRPHRAHRRAEGAGAEVLLRRARLAALRADHRAARVLPDPRRARDPRRPAAAEILAAAGSPRTLVELGSGLGREDPPPADRDGRRRLPRAPTSRSTSPRRSPTRPPRAWSRSTRASRSAASSATSSRTSS